MQKTRKLKGDLAEDFVSFWMLSSGYAILQRNLRSVEGEVDIVVYKEGTLIFVEVKSRKLGGPETLVHSINAKKRWRIIRCAEHFLAKNPCWAEYRIRFDVVFVGPENELHHYPGAFTESGFT